MAGITLPGGEAVQKVKIGRDPGVRMPGASSSGLTHLGDAISQVGAQFQEANDQRVLSNLESETTKAFSDFTSELETDPDSFEEWEDKFDKFAKDHREATRTSGANRNVTGAWERSVAPLEARTRLKVMGKARETMVNKGLAELKINLKGAQDLAITSPQADRGLYLNQSKLMVERARATGLITRATADKLDQEQMDTVEKARFQNGLAIDPEATKASLDAGDFEVSEAEMPAWNKAAETAIKNQKDQARIDETRAKKEEKEAKKLAQEETELSYIDRIDTAEPPTLQEINNSGLDAKHQLSWRKLISEEPTLDRELYADLTSSINGNGIMNGEVVTRDTITDSFRNGDLTKDAHNYLLGRWDKRNAPATEKDAARENDVKLAVGVLGNLKKNGMFNEDATVNSLDHAKAVDALVKWSAVNPEGDPINYAETVLVPKVKQGFWSKKADEAVALIWPDDAEVDESEAAAKKYLVDKGYPVSEDNIKKTMVYLSGS